MIKYVVIKCRNCDHHRSWLAAEFKELLGLAPDTALTLSHVRRVLDRATCTECRKKSVLAKVDGKLVFPTSAEGFGPSNANGSEAEQLIRRMLSKQNWLSGRDLQFLLSLARSPRLSDKQIAAVKRMYSRFIRNQGPTFFRG